MSEIKDLQEKLDGLPHVFDEKLAAGIKPYQEEKERVNKEMSQLQAKLTELQKELQKTVSREGKLRVQRGPFAGFDMLDLKIAENVIAKRDLARGNQSSILNEITESRKAIITQMDEHSILAWHDGVLEKHLGAFSANAQRGAGAMNFKQAMAGWSRGLVWNRKAMDSTTAAAGDELVPTLEAAELWLDVNLDTLVLPLLPQQTMPSNPFDIPRQFGDTNWYPIAENVQALTSDLTTGKTTLTAYGLKTGVPFSDELEEDAIVALVAEIRSGLARNAAQVIDDVLLNADTTTTNNINLDQTVISSQYAGYAHQVLGFDGIRHLPLVDNTAQRSSKGAAADAAMLYLILGRIEKYSVARRRGEVVFIGDPRSTVATMSATSLTSVMSFGDRATLSVGELREVVGVPWIRSDQMRVSSTTGLVSSTTANNTTGNVLIVNTSQWRVGFRRQITMETAREAGKGQTTMYVSFRIALAERTGTRSSAKHTGLIYGITGV